MSKRYNFRVNQIVHVKTIHVEHGMICEVAEIRDIHKGVAFVRSKDYGSYYVPVSDLIPKVLDYDDYILMAKEAMDRSCQLWRIMNKIIYDVLVQCQKDGVPLVDVAKILRKKAGRKTTNEPVSLMNLRCAARAIVAGHELCLI